MGRIGARWAGEVAAGAKEGNVAARARSNGGQGMQSDLQDTASMPWGTPGVRRTELSAAQILSAKTTGRW